MERSEDRIAMVDVLLARAGLILRLPFASGGDQNAPYDSHQAFTALLPLLIQQRDILKAALVDHNKAASDSRATLPLTTRLSRVECTIAECYLGLAYLAECADEIRLAGRTVVDKYLEEAPDRSIVPSVDQAVMHATAAVALEATPHCTSRAELILGRSLAGSNRLKACKAVEDQTERFESAQKDVEKAIAASAEAEAAAHEAQALAASKKLLGGRGTKPKEQQKVESAEAKQKKTVFELAKKSIETKQKAAAHEGHLLQCLRERADAWCPAPEIAIPAADTPATFPEGALSTAVDSMGGALLSEVALKALECLHRALEIAQKIEDFSIAYEACIEIVQMHGLRGKLKTAQFLALAQSNRFRGRAGQIFECTAASNNREKLFMVRRAGLATTHLAPCERAVKDSAFLVKNSSTWRYLDISATTEDLIAQLPSNVLALLLHVEHRPTPQVFGAILSNQDGTPVVAVSKVCGEEAQAILRHVEAAHQAEFDVRLHYMRTQGNTQSEATAELTRVDQSAAEVFSPLLLPLEEVWTPVPEEKKYLVVLQDEELQGVCVDRIPAIEGTFKACSLDFSLHMVGHRLRHAAENDVSFDPTNVRYIVDSRNESDTQAHLIGGFASDQRDPKCEAVLSKWEGRTGEDHAITQGEWQQTLANANNQSSSLLYYGFGKTLCYLEPSSLLGIDLSNVPAALLVAGVENDKAYATANKGDNTKSAARIRAESSYRTAVLFSLRGVTNVVINRQSETGSGARRVVRKLAETVGLVQQAKPKEFGISEAVLQVSSGKMAKCLEAAAAKMQSRPPSSKAGSRAGSARSARSSASSQAWKDLHPFQDVVPERPLSTIVFGLPHISLKL